MTWEEIFWITGLFGVIITNVLVIALIYTAIRFIVKTKKSLFQFLKSPDFKKIANAISGKSEKKYDDEDFDNGYITGVKEMLQTRMNDMDVIQDLDLKNANFLIRNWGHFEIVPAHTPFHYNQVIYVEKDIIEQENEAKD